MAGILSTMGCAASTSKHVEAQQMSKKKGQKVDDIEIETAEENIWIIEELKTSISKFQEHLPKNRKENYCTKELEKPLDEINDKYSYAMEDDIILRREIGKELATSGTVKMLCDLHVAMVTSKNKKDWDQTLRNSIITNLLGILIDFTDSFPEYSYIIMNHPKFLSCIREKLDCTRGTEKCTDELEGEDIDDDEIDELDASENDGFPHKTITIIHNLGMVDENISRLRDLKFVDILTKYLDYPNHCVRFDAITALADLVNDAESEVLQEGQHTFKFLNTVLKLALEDEQRHYYGFAAWELARTIRRIAMNDTNKRALVETGCLSSLVKLAQSNDTKERREAVGALWTLSFDKENSHTMVNDKNLGVVEIFTTYRTSEDEDISKSCSGALWNLREELSRLDKYKNLEITGVKKNGSHGDRGRGHLMISYNHADKKLIMYIRDYLRKAGYKVWLDVDDMAGSTLQAMASAVEEAEIVLICYSRKYKDSDNCRAEAEYAFQQRKKIVPLKMEYGYKPDGWLGIIIGSKIYHDFGGKYSVDSRLDGLSKEIKSKYDGEESVIVEQTDNKYGRKLHYDFDNSGKSMVSYICMYFIMRSFCDFLSGLFTYVIPIETRAKPVNAPVTVDVSKWTQDDVTKWLDKHSLDKNINVDSSNNQADQICSVEAYHFINIIYLKSNTQLLTFSFATIFHFQRKISNFGWKNNFILEVSSSAERLIQKLEVKIINGLEYILNITEK
ncbi:LOW QUALITY PROTEIN: hypothetical protein KUTeg_000753 [Tegillarca granosa]|uniref:TIR domain-containing protein n=1 Tax=Tegillarca granosa TaxID=220873 RepID=A0ABQ9FYF0_TEGGR|nr:LOW QUALITY PROTEIN: hypothetical protein KUTeg_000753 [Tegillarca granosa]